jgi:predicted nuclease with RNAse H fold
MEKLTERAVKSAKEVKKEGITIIKAYPTSTRKALGIPSKDWIRIQAIFLQMDLKGELSAV